MLSSSSATRLCYLLLSLMAMLLQVLPNDAVRCNPDRGRIQSGASLDLELTLNFLQPQQVTMIISGLLTDLVECSCT